MFLRLTAREYRVTIRTAVARSWKFYNVEPSEGNCRSRLVGRRQWPPLVSAQRAMFQIEFTPEAVEDLRRLRKGDQQRVTGGIRLQLLHQPDLATRNRKRLRPNALAEWELRIDEFRVFYDVDAGKQRVKIVAVGHKEGSVLFVHGEVYEL